MNNNSLIQDPMESKRPSNDAGYDQRKSHGKSECTKKVGCIKENGYVSLSDPANFEVTETNDVYNSMPPSKAKVCNGVDIAENRTSAKYLGKMISSKPLPTDIMVSKDLTEGMSNLMVNGLNHGPDDILTSLKNVSLHENVSNGGSNSISTKLTVKKSDSPCSSLSQECIYVSQEQTSQGKSPLAIGDQVDGGISGNIEELDSMNADKQNLVMCCDSPNKLTNHKDSNRATSELLLDYSLSGHKQVNQDTGKGEISEYTHNDTLAKENLVFKKAQSDSEPIATACNINLEIDGHKPLSESIKGANITQSDVTYIVYQSELDMPDIIRLIQKDLSEPYSIYTYRYFIHNWPHLCFMAKVGEECVGAIVCKLDYHKKVVKRGYIAMLAVDSKYRKLKIGSTLVRKAIETMIAEEADEVVLETEITNQPALRLYENLGFVRDKRLFRYYLNGVDALRLKLWLR